MTGSFALQRESASRTRSRIGTHPHMLRTDFICCRANAQRPRSPQGLNLRLRWSSSVFRHRASAISTFRGNTELNFVFLTAEAGGFRLVRERL
jgi:hypothetical protein